MIEILGGGCVKKAECAEMGKGSGREKMWVTEMQKKG